MQAFTTLTAKAAPLPLANIDTDMIIPKDFLRTIKRTGLGKNLFHEMRYETDGSEKPDFVLNQPPYRDAKILLAGENFGCGSSREHAPWALLDFGIHCVIAPSFADIFYNNCFKNGILPLILGHAPIEQLIGVAEKGEDLTVDLEKQMIQAQQHSFTFDIDPFRKKTLLAGLDDIGLTLEFEDKITQFETDQKSKAPWLYQKG